MKLNLGCGNDIREGYVNLDRASLPGVDVVHDLNKLPLPFKDDQFDYVLCKDIIEHLEYIPVLAEIHRIMKPGGILDIRVLHFTSRMNFTDPTHRKQFSVATFQFFTDKNTVAPDRRYYFPFHFSEVIETKIVFEKRWMLYNHFVEFLVNLNDKTQRFYEATGISRLFPAGGLNVKIRK